MGCRGASIPTGKTHQSDFLPILRGSDAGRQQFYQQWVVGWNGEYLSGVQDVSPVPVTVVANGTSRGFPTAINQGLQYARGEYLVLLNNDVVVTDGWLEQLIALASIRRTADGDQEGDQEIVGRVLTTDDTEGTDAEAAAEDGCLRAGDVNLERGAAEIVRVETRANVAAGLTRDGTESTDAEAPEGGRFMSTAKGRDGWAKQRSESPNVKLKSGIGLVGPMSNYAAPPQLVEDVPYRDLEEMKGFARRWREEHRGTWFTVRKLSGFCLMMKRVVYDAIGRLDERFGLGFFDGDDLAERARRAGFELAVARDLFVHHYGSRTFVGNGVDAERVLDENARRFAAKWGDAVPRGRRVAMRAFVAGPQTRADGEGCPQRRRGTQMHTEKIRDEGGVTVLRLRRSAQMKTGRIGDED